MSKITYHNIGYSPVKRNAYVIEEKLDGFVENRYYGYYNDKRGTFTLYPMSGGYKKSMPFCKKTVSVHMVARDF